MREKWRRHKIGFRTRKMVTLGEKESSSFPQHVFAIMEYKL
jgi:hypothetical protein